MSEPLRYAPELRQAARAGAGSSRIGSFRRASLAVRQQAKRSAQDSVLDRDGFAIWAKRLEEGAYAIPSAEPGLRRFEISVEELGALLSGIDLSSATRRKRYRRAVA